MRKPENACSKKGGVPMALYMYTVAGDCPDNEELARRVQNGDKNAAELLVSNNDGYLTELAAKHSARCDMEDLKQEGAMALLNAAKKFDPSYGTKLLTYATPAIESAMMDYGACVSTTFAIPTGRYRQLRRVAHICAEAQDEFEAALVHDICEKLNVSKKVATELLKEYLNLYHVGQPEDDIFSSDSGDPAVDYDRYMREVLALQMIEDILSPREQNVIRYRLGFGQPNGQGMTFQKLAIQLNYNDESGAKKVYDRAIDKLKKGLPSSVYGQWRAMQQSIRNARAEAECNVDIYIAPQRTWYDKFPKSK